jgi:arabinan endo-1,5-alpha-L-arabinosidase
MHISGSYIRLLIVVVTIAVTGCHKKGDDNPVDPSPPPPSTSFDINSITDTYAAIAPFSYYSQWGPYNVHDPSIVKSGDYFFCYSTDAAYGTSVKPGIQIRKSKDLIEWQFVGWVFNTLPAQGANYITQAGGTPFQSLWAPYIMKVGNQYRLYYSLSCSTLRLSVIGLATATAPEGPWTEQGLVVTSKNDFSVTQTNAIDPTVVVTPQGEHWMYYGSAFDGIYVLKLNAATGLAATSGDKGKRIAQRGFTNGTVNGNIEGPEIIYNTMQNKYYLFIEYDWLETKYNVRVGRSASSQGPFLDFNGKDLNTEEDNIPMILAPYQFQGHGGWQGVAHCAVFQDADDVNLEVFEDVVTKAAGEIRAPVPRPFDAADVPRVEHGARRDLIARAAVRATTARSVDDLLSGAIDDRRTINAARGTRRERV